MTPGWDAPPIQKDDGLFLDIDGASPPGRGMATVWDITSAFIGRL